MADVQLVVDLWQDGWSEPRRAQRTASLPGVPAAGDAVWVIPTIALKVASVSWDLQRSSATVWLRRSDANPDSFVDRDDGFMLEVPDYFIAELEKAGWTVEAP